MNENYSKTVRVSEGSLVEKSKWPLAFLPITGFTSNKRHHTASWKETRIIH